ncbi:MAG: hypothetical protein HZA03_11005 [Nitrospinae bacterium]|nr:hypothetical protein [Nitrospinota bacterium]
MKCPKWLSALAEDFYLHIRRYLPAFILALIVLDRKWDFALYWAIVDFVDQPPFPHLPSIKIIVSSIFIFFAAHLWISAKKYWETSLIRLPPLLLIDHLVLIAFFVIFDRLNLIGTPAINYIIIICFTVYASQVQRLIASQSNLDTAALMPDNAITEEGEDELERGVFVKSLCDSITSVDTKGSFVFGISGEWGDGKTSVVNLVRKKLECTKRTIVVDYSPWLYKDEDALHRAFFDSLIKGIGQKLYFPTLISDLKIYRFLLSSKLSLMDLKQFIGEWASVANTAEQVRQELPNLLARMDHRIIVIIDDIDRLDAKEIMMVLKLVRNNADLRNVIFLLAFDDVAVKQVLSKDNEYFEKFVNLQLPLPVIPEHAISKYAKARIISFLRKHEVDESAIVAANDLSAFFRNIRHVKRFCNALFSKFALIKTEVNHDDYLYLEYIASISPETIRIIFDNKEVFLNQRSLGERLLLIFSQEDEKKKNQEKRAAEVTDMIIGKIADPAKSKDLLALIDHLFPNSARIKVPSPYNAEEARRERRIHHPDCFDKYFTYVIPPKTLSDKDFQLFIRGLVNSTDKGNYFQAACVKANNEGKLDDLLRNISIHRDSFDDSMLEAMIGVFLKNQDDLFCGKNEPIRDSKYESGIMPIYLQFLNTDDTKTREKKIMGLIQQEGLLQAFFLVRTIKYYREQGYSKVAKYNFNTMVEAVIERLKKEPNLFTYKQNAPSLLYFWAHECWTSEGKHRKEVTEHVVRNLTQLDDAKLLLKDITDTTFGNRIEEFDKSFELDEVYKAVNRRIEWLTDEVIKAFIEAYDKLRNSKTSPSAQEPQPGG